jgi:hypothetical protein
MIILEFKYFMYLNDFQKKNIFYWLFKKRYKKRARERYELLKEQKGLIKKEAFDIWSGVLIKIIENGM